MSKRKLSPLVQAMNLYGQLDERDKQTLADWIRSQTARPKSVAPAAVKRSSRKNSVVESGANTEDATVTVLTAGGHG